MESPPNKSGTRELLAAPLRHAVRWIAHTPRRAFLVIFLLSSLAGLAVLPYVPPRARTPNTRWEVGAVAVSIATRGAFADPYELPTGPTAHMPPLYPAFLALLYRIFGLTLTAGTVAWLFRVAVAAAMAAMLPWLSERLGAGREAGVIGGLAGILAQRWPYEVEYAAAIATGLLLVWGLRWLGRDRLWERGALLPGVAWGAVFHLTPALFPVMAGWLAFDLGWSRDRRRWARAALTLLGAALACVPWGVRNASVLGGVFFVRSNFGLELRMGNHEGAAADVDVMVAKEGPALRHPRRHLAEARLIQEIGEAEYMRRALREAVSWILGHPGAFLALTAQRAFYFWFGAPSDPVNALSSALLTILAILGLRRLWKGISVPQRAAFLVPLITYPLVYYIVVYMPRYGATLTGILLVLAGAEVWGWCCPASSSPARGGTSAGFDGGSCAGLPDSSGGVR